MGGDIREQDRLIDLALDGRADERQLRQLAELLQQDDALLDRYLDVVDLHATLATEHSLLALKDGLSHYPPQCTSGQVVTIDHTASAGYFGRAVQFIVRPTPFSLTVAALVVGVFVAALAFIGAPHFRSHVHRPPENSKPVYAAYLTEVHAAVWVEGQQGVRPGEGLPLGYSMSLQSGLAQVVFKSGAKVIVEGPAKMVLDNEGAASLSLGKIVAEVPPSAVGFTIHTPHASVVDLGTQFGLQVDDDGAVELHMLEGRAELRPRGGEVHAITKGNAIRFDPASRVAEQIPVRSEAFTGSLAANSLPENAKFSWVATEGNWNSSANWAVEDHPTVKATPRGADDVYVSNGGTVRFDDAAGRCKVRWVRLGFQGPRKGSMIQDGGYLSANVVWAGGTGASGKYEMIDGFLNVQFTNEHGQLNGGINLGGEDAQLIGRSEFVQQGGSVITNKLMMSGGGNKPNVDSLYRMSGGKLTVTHKFSLADHQQGKGPPVANRKAVFEQTGGEVLSQATIAMGSTADATGAAIYNLNGGTLTIEAQTPFRFGADTSNVYFNFNGGALYLRGDWDFASLTAIAAADFRVADDPAKVNDLSFEPVHIDGNNYTKIRRNGN